MFRQDIVWFRIYECIFGKQGGKDEVVKNVNLRGRSCSKSFENIEKCVVQLVEDKWEIIDVIFGEDESANNDACNVYFY